MPERQNVQFRNVSGNDKIPYIFEKFTPEMLGGTCPLNFFTAITCSRLIFGFYI